MMEKAMDSGIRASATTRPASTSARILENHCCLSVCSIGASRNESAKEPGLGRRADSSQGGESQPLGLIQPEKTPALGLQARGRWLMATVAVRQLPGVAAAAEQQALRAQHLQAQTFGATGAAVGKPGRTPAGA